MAARVIETRYAANAVYGSEAYDLDWIESLDNTAVEKPVELPRERTEEKVHESAAVETAARQAFGVPVVGIIGFAVAAVMFVFMLFGYIQLAEVSVETTRLKNSITELSGERKNLCVAYENTFNLNEIEKYAVNVLGMTKLSSDNVTVFGVEKSDRAEILHQDDTSLNFIGTLTEYFK